MKRKLDITPVTKPIRKLFGRDRTVHIHGVKATEPLAHLEEKIHELLKQADIEFDKVWITVEQVYEARYDCIIGRLATASYLDSTDSYYL